MTCNFAVTFGGRYMENQDGVRVGRVGGLRAHFEPLIPYQARQDQAANLPLEISQPEAAKMFNVSERICQSIFIRPIGQLAYHSERLLRLKWRICLRIGLKISRQIYLLSHNRKEEQGGRGAHHGL